MISNLPVWLAVATLQTVAIALAGWILWKRRQGSLVLAIVFLGIGAAILAANVLWLATGGADESPILMRGGMTGFWLSSIIALEIGGLGVIALVRRKR